MLKRVIDLTHTLNNDVKPWPGDSGPKIKRISSLENGDCSNVTELTLTTHIGTHMDCQRHMLPTGYFTDDIDVSFFIGSGRAFDFRSKVKYTDGRAELGPDCLDGLELDGVDFLFFYLGWDKKWNTPEFFDNFPCINEQLASKLALLPIRGIGFETPGIDPVSSTTLSAHKIYLKQKKTVIENLTNIDKLLDKKFTYVGLPLKIEQGDGSPIRAVAILED